MALFLKAMTIVKTNKIQYFIIASIVFHIILFIVWSSFGFLKKDFQTMEIFLIQETNPSMEMPSNIKKSERIKSKKSSSIKILEKDNMDKEQNIKEITDAISIKSENTTAKETGITKGVDIYTNTTNFHSSGDRITDTYFGSMNGPKFIHREIPIYPQIARKLGKEGKVVLRLTINEKGELLNIEIIESAPYGFTESAVEAVKKSKFLPAMKDGHPIASRAILPIKFVLKN
ncbi:MAG: energy transducer TonB [Thermodesulfovibrio sp.]|nr:energy transducer TonB [Thermodesulfovibrio sp.]